MPLYGVLLGSGLILLTAYLTYGSFLSRLLGLREDVVTPAVELRDDVDYAPIEPKFLLSQHLSAIAAAGPIVGPIVAGAMFGWLPALLWILVGSIFIGGVHDMTALVASIRHKARSIAEVVREHMTRRSYIVFLTFVWISLVYIIVAFTDITASSFVGMIEMENGQTVSGPGIATSSLLYLALPIIMGLVLRYTKMSVNTATAIFLPLVGVSIWIGQYVPLSMESLTGLPRPDAQRVWGVMLLIYCFLASVAPMWILLQPRGHLGGYFLYFALGGGMLGLIIGSFTGAQTIKYPAFLGFQTEKGESLFPLLFITIACGACSGFHSIIASGTTSKQLRKEPDARVVGYGAMLLEAMVAIISLCCVMTLAPDSSAITGKNGPQPNFLYAQGIGTFLGVFGVPLAFGVSFGLMAFTTFVYDTLDVCTRLGRYILQELTGWHGAFGRWFATALTAGAPLLFLFRKTTGANGVEIPAWRVFWNLFGSSNQLLAALTLIGVTIWLYRTGKSPWIWAVTGIPTVFMYCMSMWALLGTIVRIFNAEGPRTTNPIPWVASVLAGLGLMMLIEAVVVLSQRRPRRSDPMEGTPTLAPA